MVYLWPQNLASDLHSQDEDEWDTTHGCRIMAVMYENDLDTAAYAVSITVEGDVVGIQKLQHIIKRKNSYNDKERMEKEKDLETIRQVESDLNESSYSPS